MAPQVQVVLALEAPTKVKKAEVVLGLEAERGRGRPKSVKSITHEDGGATITETRGKGGPKAVESTPDALKAAGSGAPFKKERNAEKSQEWYAAYIMGFLNEGGPEPDESTATKNLGRGKLKPLEAPAGFEGSRAVATAPLRQPRRSGKRTQEWCKTYLSLILRQQNDFRSVSRP
ncbi:unnamed protein product [Calypogeia fissa]